MRHSGRRCLSAYYAVLHHAWSAQSDGRCAPAVDLASQVPTRAFRPGVHVAGRDSRTGQKSCTRCAYPGHSPDNFATGLKRQKVVPEHGVIVVLPHNAQFLEGRNQAVGDLEDITARQFRVGDQKPIAADFLDDV